MYQDPLSIQGLCPCLPLGLEYPLLRFSCGCLISNILSSETLPISISKNSPARPSSVPLNRIVAFHCPPRTRDRQKFSSVCVCWFFLFCEDTGLSCCSSPCLCVLSDRTCTINICQMNTGWAHLGWENCDQMVGFISLLPDLTPCRIS